MVQVYRKVSSTTVNLRARNTGTFVLFLFSRRYYACIYIYILYYIYFIPGGYLFDEINRNVKTKK